MAATALGHVFPPKLSICAPGPAQIRVLETWVPLENEVSQHTYEDLDLGFQLECAGLNLLSSTIIDEYTGRTQWTSSRCFQ